MLHDLATAALRTLDPETSHNLSLRALKLGLGPRDGGLGDPALAHADDKPRMQKDRHLTEFDRLVLIVIAR